MMPRRAVIGAEAGAETPSPQRATTIAIAGLKLILRIVATLLPGLLIAASAVWGVLALYYSGPQSAVPRMFLAVMFGCFALAALIGLAVRRWRWRALGVFAVAFLGLLAWWSTIEPSNDREWKPEVAVLPHVTFDGDLVTVHNIRNFDYRTASDFTPVYYDKTFDLRRLESVDLSLPIGRVPRSRTFF